MQVTAFRVTTQLPVGTIELVPAVETFTDPRVPANAQRVHGWLPVSKIEGHDGRVWTFKPANIVFLDGGSLYWFEMPDTFCVMHARGGGEIVRYPGEWSDA